MSVATLVLLTTLCNSFDLNGDCAVDVSDVQAAILCVWSQDLVCDFDGSGAVDVSDVQLVIQAANGTVNGQTWDCTGSDACTECTAFQYDNGWQPAQGQFGPWVFGPKTVTRECADVWVDHVTLGPTNWTWNLCDPAPTGCANCLVGLDSMELSLVVEDEDTVALCATPWD